ncbi:MULTISPECIES: hypothetical protein [Streptomycetaceae]|uniref:hypothetical protein n=1 Tax=Streptomycetaceae TaxID=2062 RepID=UPI00116132D0|nr:hypothetical protein [Streptomyces sp. CB02056]
MVELSNPQVEGEMDFDDQLRRVQRARHLGEALAANIQAWSSAYPFDASAIIAEDRLSWELRLRVHAQPPLDDWGLHWGDAVHQLRAALDNLSIAIARQAGVSESRALKRIQFPICATSSEWVDGKKRIEVLPESYRIAIEEVQPFQRGGKEESDLLLLLRDLDNSDKHHLQMKPTLDPSSASHQQTVEFETEEDATASVPPKVEAFAPEWIDGALLLRNITNGRIARVSGNFSMEAVVQADLGKGRQAPALQILEMLCINTRMVVDHVARAG